MLGTFLAMEFVAWFAHKYVMHGFLWYLHKDHHQHKPGFWEKNDAFFLIFAIPSITCYIVGSAVAGMFPLFFVGVGISLYGIAYFLVHDIFIHQRFKIFTRTNHRYLKAIRKAHKVHHKHLDPEDGECFGMLVVPPKYIKEAT
jgi:beta-carotene 3-hydroxylase